MPFDPNSPFVPPGADGIDDWFVPGQSPGRIAPWSAETDHFFPDDWFVPGQSPGQTAPWSPGTDHFFPDDWFVPGQSPGRTAPWSPGTDHFFPDDWFVPGQSPGRIAPWSPGTDHFFPDDWFVPAPLATPSIGPPPQSPQPNAANPAISNRPPARPDPFAAYWAMIPASRLTAVAWAPPIFPDAFGRFPLMPPAPAPRDFPPDFGTGGLLGAIARLPAANRAAPTSLLGTPGWAASGSGDLSPSLLDNSANSPLSPSSIGTDDGDQSAPQSVLQGLAAPDLMASPYMSGSATGYPTVPLDPTGWSRTQLAAGDREKIDPEEIFDPLAPLRVDLYNAARYDLRQIQPNNYALSVPSFRTFGGAPTIDEIGELKYAYGIAQSTQPLAEQAARIAGLLSSRAQNHRAVAVLQTSEGTFIAGSGAEGLRRAQRDAVVAEGAIQIPTAGEGVHAEIAALEFATNRGKSQFIAASKPFCATGCRQAIQKAGGLITSPTTAVFPLNIPSMAFPLR
jgi:hypothetical protein